MNAFLQTQRQRKELTDRSLVQKKPKDLGLHWPYSYEVNDHFMGCKYVLQADLLGGADFGLYKHIANKLILVDSFNSYDEANAEAKQIIKSRSVLRNMFFTGIDGGKHD